MNRCFLGAILALLALAGSAFADGEPDGSLRTWLDAEYLLWWVKPAPTPEPLLTTGPLTTPTSAGSGVFGNPNTQLLTGNNTFNQGPYDGFRLNAGWIHCSDTFGVEGSFFMLTQHAANVNLASDPSGNPLLARPVIDANTGAESVLLVSAPGAFSGSINFASTTELFGGDINALWPIQITTSENDVISYFHFLTGARYLELREDLSIGQTSSVLPGGIGFYDGLPVQSPGSISITDDFHSLNQFYGGQIGARVGLVWWRFALSATGKVALGTMREEVNISGSTTMNPLIGPSQTTSGGLLALGSNMGSYTRNMLAVVPEGNLTLTFEITPQIKLMLGGTFLYISDVARPGDQIDRVVNRTELPSSQSFSPLVGGPARPAFSWNGTDFWATGVNIGIGLRF
jgi:Putative beta barrel porin-7 (BBP7)